MTITARPRTATGAAHRRRIGDWRPDDPVFWAERGRRVAARNLACSIFAEHVGFSVWALWSVLVLFLGPGYHIDPAGRFLLTTLPAAVGSVLRLPYTFAIARFGGRTWTVVSASLLLVPAVAAAVVVHPGVSYSTLLVVATAAGVGGGNFASSMANINAFYPQRLKGWALGLNAGGGNVGVAVVQLAGLAVLATAGRDHPRLLAGIYIPLVVLAALGAGLFMDDLPHVTGGGRAVRDVARDGHAWAMSLLYIGTFGSFIGFGFAFGQVLIVQFAADFDTPVKAACLTFLGPLLGSLIRPVGGRLADRAGGAKVTFWTFVAMTLSAGVVLAASSVRSLPLFVAGFVLLFAFSGIGNGSAYTMIPAIFRAKAAAAVHAGAEPYAAEAEARRLSAGLIGLAAAIGAFGGVLVDIAFRQSFLAYRTGNAAYLGFIAYYALCLAVTWAVYLRPSPRRLPGV